MDVPNNLPLIKGDRTRLMQVVLNILKNGIDSIVESGAGKNLCIEAGVEEGWLILRVRDSGGGYAEVVRDRLFERGFTTRRSGAATGLYNSRVIMESHGGMVDLTSEGAGTGAVAKVAFRL
jgi:signal transduction histidine kinase